MRHEYYMYIHQIARNTAVNEHKCCTVPAKYARVVKHIATITVHNTVQYAHLCVCFLLPSVH